MTIIDSELFKPFRANPAKTLVLLDVAHPPNRIMKKHAQMQAFSMFFIILLGSE